MQGHDRPAPPPRLRARARAYARAGTGTQVRDQARVRARAQADPARRTAAVRRVRRAAACARPGTALAALAAFALIAGCSSDSAPDRPGPASATSATARAPAPTAGATRVRPVRLPPPHADFDYQIGGAYPPPRGVTVVDRDHGDSPAAGLYGICYVNAFQAQAGAAGGWAADLLLRDARGRAVYDTDWHEALLDLSTAGKRERVARKVDGWIDACADKGFQAVEPDNLDSYTRSGGRLTAADAEAYVRLLTAHAHARGLAVGQKNAADLTAEHRSLGLDFAITEECGAYGECGVYAAGYGDQVIDVEYSAAGLSRACDGWGARLTIVRRDLDVSPAGSAGYTRRTC